MWRTTRGTQPSGKCARAFVPTVLKLTLVPTLDDLSPSKDEGDVSAVKHGPVGQLASVVHLDLLAGLGARAISSLQKDKAVNVLPLFLPSSQSSLSLSKPLFPLSPSLHPPYSHSTSSAKPNQWPSEGGSKKGSTGTNTLRSVTSRPPARDSSSEGPCRGEIAVRVGRLLHDIADPSNVVK